MISKYKTAKNEKLKKKALRLYKQSLTLREVGKLIGRSHQWVANAIHEKAKS